MSYGKNDTLIDHQTTAVVTPTGFSLINNCNEYEWSSKSPDNAVHALYKRHLVPKIRPDPAHIRDFHNMTRRYFNDAQ